MKYLEMVAHWVTSIRDTLSAGQGGYLVSTLTAFIVIAIALTLGIVLETLWRTFAKRWTRTHMGISALVVQSKLFPRVLHLVPQFVLIFLASTAFHAGFAQKVVTGFAQVYLIWICCAVISAVLSLGYVLSNRRRGVVDTPLKGLVQAVSLIVYCTGVVCAVAMLTGKSPVYILSGLTALSAVLMLIFKDAILGMTAGLTLAGNKLVRIGDWVEMPSAGADGNIMEISLTTVRVQNWDNTITSVPAYDLISKSFKNWRNMEEVGGRRIKRSMYIDIDSVKFADETMLDAWREIDLIRDYLAGKIREVRAYNQEHVSTSLSVVNARMLTNIGTFRAYCLAYLRAQPDIHQGMTVLVRQLQPTANGIPLEVYCFTRKTGWSDYEQIQSDIFDHFLAILPAFGLSCFQVTSAASIERGVTRAVDKLSGLNVIDQTVSN